jgi:hypothetical protein
MDIVYYLFIAVVAGMGLIFWLSYRSLQGTHRRIQAELHDLQAKHNALQATLLEEQAKAYQARQGLLARQNRLESDLAEAGERYAELEQQHAELKAQQNLQLQAHLRKAEQWRETIERLEQEQVALQDRFDQQCLDWDRERQSLLLQGTQIDDRTQMLHQDKAALEARLEQQREAWEHERLALQIQIHTLEDNLALQKARASHALPPDSVLLVEQLRAEAAAELNRQRFAWEEEREALQRQVNRLQAERQVPPVPAVESGAAMSGQSGSVDQELAYLRQQLEQAQADR